MMAKLERLGFCASALCAVHCVVMPFVLAAQPLFHWFRMSRVVDNASLALATVVGLIVCARNLPRHRDCGPVTLLLVGLVIVGLGRFFSARTLVMGGPSIMA